jgi:hypothetical protein
LNSPNYETPNADNAAPPIPNGVEIIRILEYDNEECGGTQGYYALGFWHPQSFAIAVNKDYDLASNGKPCITGQVRYCYVSPDYCDLDDIDTGEMECLFFSDTWRPDSQAVTVWHVN